MACQKGEDIGAQRVAVRGRGRSERDWTEVKRTHFSIHYRIEAKHSTTNKLYSIQHFRILTLALYPGSSPAEEEPGYEATTN